MSDANVRVIFRDLGVINDIHVWEVIDADTNEIIGYNETFEGQIL